MPINRKTESYLLVGPNFKSASSKLRPFSVEHLAYASYNLQT